MVTLLNKLSPMALGVLRIVAGFLFWQHGAQKLLGWFGGEPVSAFSMLWFAGWVETIGGALIAFGLLTRPVAIVLAGEMLAAHVIAPLLQGLWPLRNGGVPALLFGFIFLHLAAAGPGAMALDSLPSGKVSRSRWTGKFAPATLLILRLGAAVIFWQFGASKFLGLFGGRPPGPFQLRWFAGVMEFFGSPLIAAGLWTRAVAFLLSGEMAVAFWTSHAPRGPSIWPIQNGGEPAVLFCFIYLYLVTSGPGLFSLDGARSRKP